MKRDGRAGPTPDDLEAEFGAMGLLDLVEDLCRDHGASVAVVLGGNREPHAVRARWEAMHAIHSIVDDLTGRRRYSLTTIGRTFGRDHTSVKSALEKRADTVRAFAKAHQIEPAPVVAKLAPVERKTAKAPQVVRPVVAGAEVHVWVLKGTEQIEPVDPLYPVLCDGGGHMIVPGRIYKGRTYAGRRAAGQSAPAPAASPVAPASGTRRTSEAA